MDEQKLKNILEAGLLVAGRTLSIAQLEGLFQHDDEKPERKAIRAALEALQQEYEGRGIELVEVASGFRLQSHESVSDWVANLFQEKTPRYSRALLETLVLIAYRQPITRAEIEDVRGVAVSSNIIKTLQERSWVKVLGHKDVPGKPALLGTTKDFLDYFNLKKLDELPDLADIKDLDQFDELLAEEVGEVDEQGDAANDDAADNANAHDASEGNATNGANNPSESNHLKSNDDETEEGESEDGEQDGDGLEGQASAQQSGNAAADEVTDADSNIDDADSSAEDEANTAGENSASADEINDQMGDNPEHNETLSGPELDLLRVISEFSEEHQQEIDARDQMEEGIIAKDDDVSPDDASLEESADLSQRISDDQQSGEMPSPGDTLH